MKPIIIPLVVLLYSSIFLNSIFGTSPVIIDAEIRDLQLLQTYQGTPGIIKNLNKTITATGSDFFKKRLLNPIADQEKLLKRQQALTLIQDEGIESTLDTNLRAFKTHEQGLYSFIRDQDPFAKRSIENLYFKNRYFKGLNRFPAGLDFAQAVFAVNLLAPVAEHALIHFFVNEALHEYLGMCCSHSHHDHGHAHPPKEHKYKHEHHEHKASSAGAVWAYYTYNVVHTLIHTFNLKELAELLKEQVLTIRQMQEQLIAVRRCLDATREMVNATSHLPADAFEYQELVRALGQKNQDLLSPQLYELVTLLEKNTFCGNPSVFSRQGNILRAYALAQQTMPELLAALEGVGELDTLRACNSLLHNTQENTPFCMVDFSRAETPALSINGFWNLLNQNPAPIKQTLCLGNTNPHIAIITGANKAGKSTASSSITHAIICAQTLAIAPAQAFTLTPFAHICTCFNANARVCDGQSLFSTSVNFADQTLAQCADGQFIFVATDELFNSTEFTRGQIINNQMALNLAQYPNCIALMATHFQATTALERQAPDAIINLKAEVDQDGYHLRPGIGSTENILELVKESELIKRTGLV